MTDNYGTRKLRQALEDTKAPRTGMHVGTHEAIVQPSHLAHHLREFDAQSLELQHVSEELRRTQEAMRESEYKAAAELQAVREALRELLTHVQCDCDARTCMLPCHLIDKAQAALKQSRGA